MFLYLKIYYWPRIVQIINDWTQTRVGRFTKGRLQKLKPAKLSETVKLHKPILLLLNKSWYWYLNNGITMTKITTLTNIKLFVSLFKLMGPLTFYHLPFYEKMRVLLIQTFWKLQQQCWLVKIICILDCIKLRVSVNKTVIFILESSSNLKNLKIGFICEKRGRLHVDRATEQINISICP